METPKLVRFRLVLGAFDAIVSRAERALAVDGVRTGQLRVLARCAPPEARTESWRMLPDWR
eukprot:2748882-Prymnesium_polylepis.1